MSRMSLKVDPKLAQFIFVVTLNASFFPSDPDSDSVSISRRSIEDRLVEEYRTCSDYKQSRAELGEDLQHVPITRNCMNTNGPLILLLSVPERIIQGRQRTTTAPSRTITYNTGFLTQFRWVLKRTFRNLLLNPQTSVAQVSAGHERFGSLW